MAMGIINESGALTWICTTNLRLRRAACRTRYTLRAFAFAFRDFREAPSLLIVIANRQSPIANCSSKMKNEVASVAGLAPARFCLKGRARDLLCIHGPEVENGECKVQSGPVHP